MTDLGLAAFAADRRHRAVRAALLMGLFAAVLPVRALVGPKLLEQGRLLYNFLPYMAFLALAFPLYYGLAGAVVLALPAVWKDLRLRRRSSRQLLALAAGLLLLVLPTVCGVSLFCAHQQLPAPALLSSAFLFLIHYPVCFLPLGAGLYAGLVRR